VPRYRATVAYAGTDFHGWQVQANAERTVQAVLQDALAPLSSERVRVEGASRTDAGVHAEGQVAHFDLAVAREPRAVRDAANRRLPADVRVLDVRHADPVFHARFDARWKEYAYRWNRSPVVPPRDAPYVAPISPRADPDRMREAARLLPGERDFGVFAVRTRAGESTIRTLHSVSIEEEEDRVTAVLRGDGFLRGMVRSICGVLADVGRGRLPPERIAELLRTGDRTLLAVKAPAKGLTLVRVEYEREPAPLLH
jgi:tRNA pseudouridine38-40 synthase